MKKIVIADYLGNSQKNGTPSGHLAKLLREINCLLKDDFELQYCLCDNYIRVLENEELKVIGSLKRISSCENKLKEVLCRINNITNILKKKDDIWFVNIDFWFFLILNFTNIRNKKIYITNYIDCENISGRIGRIKKYIYKKASKKIFCEFTTNHNCTNVNQVYVPDYWFDEKSYAPYLDMEKNNSVSFCGTISKVKEVIKLIEIFNKNSQSLNICGKFESKQLFEEAIQTLGNNESIQIIDKRLSDDEYYRVIAGSRFIVLPYKKESYSGRSSGVILEALFLNTIVIAPDFMLNKLGIHGIGYRNIDDLENFCIEKLENKKIDEYHVLNDELKHNFSKTTIKSKYCEMLKR